MFTVVIPLHNKAATLQRTLDSIYAQSFAPAEILVVNDGSTDGGDGIARRQTDPRVRVIDQPQGGVSRARNAGLRAAVQPFVAFLDADDRWRPGFLERMKDLIERHPAAALYGAGFVTVSDDEPPRYHGIGRSAADPRPAGPIDFFAERLRDFPLHTSTTVVPKEAAIASGGFAEGVAFAEDHLFWTTLALTGPVVITPEPLSEYDVSVPGQAIEYWQTAYRERFDILEYHRFLAAELRKRVDAGGASDSFSAVARKELRTAVLQRILWGKFDAAERIWRELDLAGLGIGPAASWSVWAAGQPVLRPLLAAAARVTRSLRRR